MAGIVNIGHNHSDLLVTCVREFYNVSLHTHTHTSKGPTSIVGRPRNKDHPKNDGFVMVGDIHVFYINKETPKSYL